MLKLYSCMFILLILSGCASLENDNFVSVGDVQEYTNTLRGKTLINFENCATSKGQECETVLYLGEDISSDSLNPAVEINFSENKIINTTWGFGGSFSTLKLGERMFGDIDITYMHRHVSFSPDKKMLKIQYSNGGEPYFYAVKDADYSYLNLAKSRGFAVEKGAKPSNFFGELAGRAIIGAANSIAEAAKTPSINNHASCHSDDTCFDVLESKNNNRHYKIRCTKGQYTGRDYNICGNEKGKWATGCGISDVFAFHYDSLKEAGYIACK